MARKPVAIQTSTTIHGLIHPGTINPISETTRPKADGVKIVIQTDTVVCSAPGHGTVTFTQSSSKAKHGGVGVVYEGCTTSCGATLKVGTGNGTTQISE